MNSLISTGKARYCAPALASLACLTLLGGPGVFGTASAGSAVPLQGTTFSVVVESTSNAWSGGEATPPDPGGGGGGTAAVAIDLPAGTTSVSNVSATGSINIDYVGFGSQGPAGLSGTPIQRVRTAGATSGLASATWAPLVGVFGTAIASTSKHPAKLKYLTSYPTTVSPQLWQMFYVGTGETPGGVAEVFTVPAGATTLYLGIPDCAPLTKRVCQAGDFNDNSGSFSVTGGLNAS